MWYAELQRMHFKYFKKALHFCSSNELICSFEELMCCQIHALFALCIGQLCQCHHSFERWCFASREIRYFWRLCKTGQVAGRYGHICRWISNDYLCFMKKYERGVLLTAYMPVLWQHQPLLKFLFPQNGRRNIRASRTLRCHSWNWLEISQSCSLREE